MIFSNVVTLMGVCGLAVGSLVVLRALKGGGLAIGTAQPIRVLSRQSAGAGTNLLLVEVDGERLLLGVSKAGIALIEAKPRVQSNVVPIERGFSAIIRRAGASR